MTDTHTILSNLSHAAINGQNVTIGGGLFKPSEIKTFLSIYQAGCESRTKGWALAKSLQTQVNILLPVVDMAAAGNTNADDLQKAAVTALEALAAHRET